MQICQVWCGITRPCCAFDQYTGNSSRTLLVRFSFRHCSPHPMPHEAWANRYQIYNTQPTSIRSADRPHHPQTKKGAPDCPWPCPRGRRPEWVGHFTPSHPTWGGWYPPVLGQVQGGFFYVSCRWGWSGATWGARSRSGPTWRMGLALGPGKTCCNMKRCGAAVGLGGDYKSPALSVCSIERGSNGGAEPV